MTGFLPQRIRKIRLCSIHPYPSNFFPFFFANFLLVSMFLLLDWRAADHAFIASFQREHLVPHDPSYGRKERSCTILWSMETNCWNQNRNQDISVSFFAFFYCRSAGLCILKLVHWIFPTKELWVGYICFFRCFEGKKKKHTIETPLSYVIIWHKNRPFLWSKSSPMIVFSL